MEENNSCVKWLAGGGRGPGEVLGMDGGMLQACGAGGRVRQGVGTC